MPKRDYREDWRAIAVRYDESKVTERIAALLGRSKGYRGVDWQAQRTLKAIRHYKALSQTGWQKPPPSIVEKQLVRFLTRLNKVVARGTIDAVQLIREIDSGHKKLSDAARFSGATVISKGADQKIALQTLLDYIGLAVRENRMSDASKLIEAFPKFVQRIIDSIKIKERGAKRVDQPRMLLIKDLNRAWNGHDEELWVQGEGNLDESKLEFFLACFQLAGEGLKPHDVKRHWKAYKKEFGPRKVLAT